jgi:hypothetical protein
VSPKRAHELLGCAPHGAAIDIGALAHLEPDLAQHVGDCHRVGNRLRAQGCVPVLGVADHERSALLGERLGRRQGDHCRKHEQGCDGPQTTQNIHHGVSRDVQCIDCKSGRNLVAWLRRPHGTHYLGSGNAHPRLHVRRYTQAAGVHLDRQFDGYLGHQRRRRRDQGAWRSTWRVQTHHLPAAAASSINDRREPAKENAGKAGLWRETVACSPSHNRRAAQNRKHGLKRPQKFWRIGVDALNVS